MAALLIADKRTVHSTTSQVLIDFLNISSSIGRVLAMVVSYISRYD